MENAVEALEMAFAMLVFLLALALALFIFGRVKGVSDSVEASREVKYLDYVSTESEAALWDDDLTGNTRVARIVKAKDILPVLYSYSTETQSIIIDFDTNSLSNTFNQNVRRGPGQGRFVFGVGSLGAFNLSLNAAENELTYYIYDWGAAQQVVTLYGVELENKLTIKDYIDAFVSGRRLAGIGSDGTEYGVKKQKITETIEDGQITKKQTDEIVNNEILNFELELPYLMSTIYRDKDFVETYEKFNLANNIRKSDGTFLKYKSEYDESEDKEYIYITYTLLP